MIIRKMDTFQSIFHSMHENSFQLYTFTHYSSFWFVCILICLLILHYIYSKFILKSLDKTKIPKLYKIIIHHSLWMGCIHGMTSFLCSLQSNSPPQTFFIKGLLDVASANFCQQISTFNDSDVLIKHLEGTHEWIPFNALSINIICAVLTQEILLATRNKMNYIFYSRLLGLIFIISAGRTGCPMLSIQGSLLMSINTSSKEIACALAAWKSYSQDDSDLRPSVVIKMATFFFFVMHIVIWISLMLFYLPLFIHKLPSVTETDVNRFFLAYAYLSLLAYIVLEVATSPLWTTIRCLGWCRRSSGLMWRILALSDCHLLGHYSPLLLELHKIQMILDQKKALFRNRMVQKHLASVEGRKRKLDSESQVRRPSLLAAVKTMVALKKKIQRRKEDLLTHSKDAPEPSDSVVDTGSAGPSVSLGDISQEIGKAEDPKDEREQSESVTTLEKDCDNSPKTLLEKGLEVPDKAESDCDKGVENTIERSIIEATMSQEGIAL